MKKLFIIFVGLSLIFAWSGLGQAQEKKSAEPAKAAGPGQPAETGKPAEVKKEAPPKPVIYRIGGIVVALDKVINKITIKQDSVKKQRKLALTVGKKAAKNMEEIKVGDAVNVWITDKTVTSITKVY